MKSISFEVFQPEEKKFRWAPNLIVFSLWGVTIAFLWAFDSVIPPESALRIFILVCVVLVNIYYMITAFFKYEPLNGKLGGEIIFNGDSIVINEQVFDLRTISHIDFAFGDYFGSRAPHSYCNPSLSQGVNNFITFKDSNQQLIQTYFKILDKNEKKVFYPFINEAVRQGAMTYYRAIDLIDVENVIKPTS